jgi:hypothetical protein
MNPKLTESMRGTPPPKSTEEAWKEREKYISQLESRLRALWDKYDCERAHYIDRIKRLEEALGLVLKMRNDWLEMQEDGYAGAYYAFVKGNDTEWEEIIRAKESKP